MNYNRIKKINIITDTKSLKSDLLFSLAGVNKSNVAWLLWIIVGGHTIPASWDISHPLLPLSACPLELCLAGTGGQSCPGGLTTPRRDKAGVTSRFLEVRGIGGANPRRLQHRNDGWVFSEITVLLIKYPVRRQWSGPCTGTACPWTCRAPCGRPSWCISVAMVF